MKKELDSVAQGVRKFDIGDYSLALLSSRAAINIDNHIIGRDDVNYSPITRLGKIMYMAVEPQVTSHNSSYIGIEEDAGLHLFLRNLFGVSVRNSEESVEQVSWLMRERGLDLITLRDKSVEEQEELRDFCVELSQKANSYWHFTSPYGFKSYVA